MALYDTQFLNFE